MFAYWQLQLRLQLKLEQLHLQFYHYLGKTMKTQWEMQQKRIYTELCIAKAFDPVANYFSKDLVAEYLVRKTTEVFQSFLTFQIFRH